MKQDTVGVYPSSSVYIKMYIFYIMYGIGKPKNQKLDCGPNMIETRSARKADTVPVSDVRVVLKT